MGERPTVGPHLKLRALLSSLHLRLIRHDEEMRVIVLEFLDTDTFHLSKENCVSFLDPLI